MPTGNALKQQRAAERRADYLRYMNSPEWYDLKKKVFERANGICEGCAEARPVQVHHLTYEHFGHELLWELAAVCRACHERCHGK